MPLTKFFKLSPSALNVFLDCPRCFWRDKIKGIARPRGIFPSLPGGMDRVIKDYFDGYRARGVLPPDLSGEDFSGTTLFPDQAMLNRWRNWRTGLQYSDSEGQALIGALDDLLLKKDRHIPFDYKTKGSPTTAEDAVKYYQNQLDVYALMLESNGYPTTGYGFLLYYSPHRCGEDGNVAFHIQPVRIGTDPRRALEIFGKAVSVLRGPLPLPGPNCEYCAWLQRSGGVG